MRNLPFDVSRDLARVTQAVVGEWKAAYHNREKARARAVADKATGLCVTEEHGWWGMDGLNGLAAGVNEPDVMLFGVYGNQDKSLDHPRGDRFVDCTDESALVVINLDTGAVLKGQDVHFPEAPINASN